MEFATAHIGIRLLTVFALVFANGFFVAAEYSIVTVRKTRIDQLIAEGNRLARTVRRAVNNPASYIAATQLGVTMASLGLGWIGEPTFEAMIEPAFGFMPTVISRVTAHTISATLAFALITALHIVLGELAPKTVALQHPESISMYIAKPTELFMRGLWPFIVLLNGMGNVVVGAFGMKTSGRRSMAHTEEELKMLVTASQEAGVLEEDEEQMLHRVFGFGDLTAGQVMVPRTEMTAIPIDAPLSEVVDQVSRQSVAALPVYGENLDHIVGILQIRDLLKALTTSPSRVNLGSLVREALILPETMKADDVLAEMRRRGFHQAIIIDEYGGTAGMVTFEDLMERIIGDPARGPAGAAPRIAVQPDGSAVIDGLALVTDLNAQFGLHIDEETYNTVGGYVLGRLGRRASIGDTVEVNSRAMRVEALDGLRVARVWLSREGKEARPTDEGQRG
jgi:CBS domain containing-hemolysin-like protein